MLVTCRLTVGGGASCHLGESRCSHQAHQRLLQTVIPSEALRYWLILGQRRRL